MNKNLDDDYQNMPADNTTSNYTEPSQNDLEMIISFVIGAIGTGFGLFQLFKRKKEEKRHRNEERLAKEAIQKQDAEIKDLSIQAEKAEHLGTINEALVKALESENEKREGQDGQK